MQLEAQVGVTIIETVEIEGFTIAKSDLQIGAGGAGAAVALLVLFEGDFKGVAEARRAGAPRALALSIGLASKDMKHAAAQACITAAGRALQAFAALNYKDVRAQICGQIKKIKHTVYFKIRSNSFL